MIVEVTHPRQHYLHEHAKWRGQRLCAGDQLEIRHPVCDPCGAYHCIIRLWMMINKSCNDLYCLILPHLICVCEKDFNRELKA